MTVQMTESSAAAAVAEQSDKQMIQEEKTQHIDGQLSDDDIVDKLSNIQLVLSDSAAPTHAYTHCDLSHLHLTNITPLYTFTQLQHVNLSHNKLTDGSINHLLTHLHNVSSLDLSHNHLTCFLAGGTASPGPALTHLNLSHNALTSLSDLRVYTNLYILDVSHNNLSEITPKIANLQRLHTLSLSHNHLTSLRHLTCPALVKLDVSHNKLKQLDLPAVQPLLLNVNIAHNQLTSLTSSHASLLPCIEAVDVSSNQFTNVAAVYALNDCKHIHTLNVVSNQLPGDARLHLIYNISHLSTIDGIQVDGKQRFDANMLYDTYTDALRNTHASYLPGGEQTTQQAYDTTVNHKQPANPATYWRLHLCQPSAIECMAKYQHMDIEIDAKQSAINIDLSGHTIQPSAVWYICDLLVDLATTTNGSTPPVTLTMNGCTILSDDQDDGRVIAIRHLLHTLKSVQIARLSIASINVNVQHFIDDLCALIAAVPTLQSLEISNNTLGQHNGQTLSCPALRHLLDTIAASAERSHAPYEYLNLAGNQLDKTCMQLLCRYVQHVAVLNISDNGALTGTLDELWYTLRSNTSITTLTCQRTLTNADWSGLCDMLLVHNSTVANVDISNNTMLFTEPHNVELLRGLLLHHSQQRISAFVLQSMDVSNTGLTTECYNELSQLSMQQTHPVKLICSGM